MFKIGDRLIKTAIRPESLYGIGSIVEVVDIVPLSRPDIFGRPYRIQVMLISGTENYGTFLPPKGHIGWTDPREFKLYTPRYTKTKALHATNT